MAIQPLMNARSRLTFLIAVIESAVADLAAGRIILSERMKQSTEVLLASYKDILEMVENAYKLRGEKVAVRQQAEKELLKFANHFWSSLVHLIDRKDLELWHLKKYKTFMDGSSRPSPKGLRSLILVAEEMIKGDAKSADAGMDPITNPSAKELAEKIEVAKAINNELIVINADLDQLRAEQAEVVEEIRLHHLSVAHYLRHSLVKRNPSARRAIMRRYGFSYRRNRAEDSPEPPIPEDDPDIDLDLDLPTRLGDEEQEPTEDPQANPPPQTEEPTAETPNTIKGLQISP